MARKVGVGDQVTDSRIDNAIYFQFTTNTNAGYNNVWIVNISTHNSSYRHT